MSFFGVNSVIADKLAVCIPVSQLVMIVCIAAVMLIPELWHAMLLH